MLDRGTHRGADVGRFFLLLAVGAIVGVAGCVNDCERLCEAYYQMELRCTLLPCDASANPPELGCPAESTGSCSDDTGASLDENVEIQNAEYRVQQCQSDYRRLRPGSDGEPSEAEVCQTYLPEIERILEDYDSKTNTCDRLVLCEEFVNLQTELGLE